MSKIYLITSGCYSDYGVETYFTDRLKAEKFCAIKNKTNEFWDDLRVEELSSYEGEINYDSITLHKGYRFEYMEGQPLGVEEWYSEEKRQVEFLKNGCWDIGIVFNEDLEKAKKIFFDELAKRKALKEGV